MKITKFVFLSVLFTFFYCTDIIGQGDKLDVEGDVKIRGNIDISHKDDVTSLNIGIGAGVNTDYSDTRFYTYVGFGAGRDNTTGMENSYFGHHAGVNNTIGKNNAFFGTGAGSFNIDGGRNSYFGYIAGLRNTTAVGNSFFGYATGENNKGNGNSFFGRSSGNTNELGIDNSFFGTFSGINNSSGNYNSFFGVSAGGDNTTGNRNTYIGWSAGHAGLPITLDRSIAIGYNSTVNCNNCAVIGGTGADAVKVGIGVSTPINTLHVNGTARVDKITLGSGLSNDKLLLYDSGAETYGMGIDNSTFRFHLGNSGAAYRFYNDDALMGASQIFTIKGNGDVNYSGTLTNISDIRLKENFENINDPLEKISQLKGFIYNLIGNPNRRTGVSAQDVEKVLPVAVSEIREGYLGVDYTQLVPLLIEGMKEQQTIIERQQDQLAKQQDQIDLLTTSVAEILEEK